jgi:hypothetical protein
LAGFQLDGLAEFLFLCLDFQFEGVYFSLDDSSFIWLLCCIFVSLSEKMDLLVAKSTSALLSAGMAIMGLVVVLVVCCRWSELHIGPDGVYLV